MNTGDMEKYCPKPHPVYFNAFSMWQQLSGSVQYLITGNIDARPAEDPLEYLNPGPGPSKIPETVINVRMLIDLAPSLIKTLH